MGQLSPLVDLRLITRHLVRMDHGIENFQQTSSEIRMIENDSRGLLRESGFLIRRFFHP